MPPGFDEAEAAFLRWCDVLLLEAMQRCGFMLASGEGLTANEMAGQMPGASLTLITDLLQMLKDAAFLQLQGSRLAVYLFNKQRHPSVDL